MSQDLPIPLTTHAPPVPVERRTSSSYTSSSSSHALDLAFELGLTSQDGQALQYIDFDGQLVYKKSDIKKSRSLKQTFVLFTRASAMPVRPLAMAILWATTASLITWGTSKGYGPEKRGECRWWCTPLAVDGDALSYVGFALFLLTSFRVQEAYSRYMEGARVWTNIGGTITSFSKYVVQAFDPGMFHRGDRERILGFLVAFPVALKRELRGERDLRELKGVLCQDDLAKLQNATSMPSYCLYVLSGYVMSAKTQESRLPQSFIVHLIGWIADLAGAADVCGQIKTMPAPYSYISHLNAFLSLWLLLVGMLRLTKVTNGVAVLLAKLNDDAGYSLPFALVESTGWGTILIVAFISYGILGVVANAAELEDPFGSDYNDLPLGRIAKGIQDAVAATYHEAKQGGRDNYAREVKDDHLVQSEEYWLKPAAVGVQR